MKKIEAVIKPFKLEAVKRALTDAGVEGMAVSEVRGAGRKVLRGEAYSEPDYTLNFLPKLKIEIVVGDSHARRITDVIAATAKTGKNGDGKIFVLPVDMAVRIRTGEFGDDAV